MKKLLPKNATNAHAYIYPEGILFRFRHKIKVGATYKEIPCIARLRGKPFYAHAADKWERAFAPYPYMLEVGEYGVSEDILLSIERCKHYYKAYQNPTFFVAEGLRVEGTYAKTSKHGTLECYLFRDESNKEVVNLGSGLRPLFWVDQTLDEAWTHETTYEKNHVFFDLDWNDLTTKK